MNPYEFSALFTAGGFLLAGVVLLFEIFCFAFFLRFAVWPIFKFVFGIKSTRQLRSEARRDRKFYEEQY